MSQKVVAFLIVILSVMLTLGQTGIAVELPPTVWEAITSLESVLGDYKLASGWVPGWGDYEFARYTGGRLSSIGYDVRLARAGDAWWVVVYISVQDEKFPVPVVPGYPAEGPSAFKRGTYLGHVPVVVREGTRSFAEKYLEWEELVTLPANTPPIAQIRILSSTVKEGDATRFLGLMSYDPDGMIIRFLWDFGDGEISFAMNPDHSYASPGTYVVKLTVIDDGGLAGTATISVTVVSKDEGGTPSPGCGCGG